MSTAIDPGLDLERLRRAYARDAMWYSRSLTEENLMESYAQGTQRAITLESFRVIRTMRPDIQCFNEILIQYPRPGENPDKPGRVVPDNMIVVHPEPIENFGSWMMPIQKIIPTLVMEYVSDSNTRKDYEASYAKYEEFVQAPFYLIFDPDEQTLVVNRLARGKYLQLVPNAEGRLPIAELELEVAILEGWVRFWFRGELVPLAPDLAIQSREDREARVLAERERDAANKRADTANKRADDANRERETALARAAELEAELAKLRNTAK
jgi:hypothetical protein